MRFYVSGLIAFLLVWLVVGAWRLRKRRVAVGPAAAGAMFELLDDRRRAALEVIVGEKTGERDPERAAGES